jgi:hypothetical protein
MAVLTMSNDATPGQGAVFFHLEEVVYNSSIRDVDAVQWREGRIVRDGNAVEGT